MVSRWNGKLAGGAAQASVEFVAVLPALAVCLVIAGQTVVVGWTLWSAGSAARAGARAEAAARRALPGALRDGAEVRSGDWVRVRVRVPGLIPGISMPSVTAASTLDGNAAS
jgi:hypothetical protein